MIPCDQCRRGWIPSPTGWADPCKVCGGSGELSLHRLAYLTGVDESTVKRLWNGGRTRVKTAQRILSRLSEYLAPPKQPELLR